MKIGETVRNGVKLLTGGSVQMMLGGVISAIMPPQISIPYKVATYIGSFVVSMYATEKLDEFVDKKIDEVEETVETVKAMVAEAKQEADITEKSVEA